MKKFIGTIMVIFGVVLLKPAICFATDCKEVNYFDNVNIISENISKESYDEINSLYKDLLHEYDETLDVNCVAYFSNYYFKWTSTLY